MRIILPVWIALLLASTPGWAVLGEYESSIALDQQHLHAQLREVVRQGYVVKQLKSANGNTVREYVSPSGLVFGIAWDGPAMPDLRQLLGAYFGEWQQAAQSRRQRHGPLVLRTKDLFLASGGHMRSFHGIAYAPKLLPVGVTAEVVR